MAVLVASSTAVEVGAVVEEAASTEEVEAAEGGSEDCDVPEEAAVVSEGVVEAAAVVGFTC